MLLEFSLQNFAIIEKQTIQFDSGLTVLAGETGAGKSILIDAIYLLVGGRASSEWIRHGQKKAELEGFFQFDNDDHPALLQAAELGIEVEENTLIFRRELSLNGKSICKINGKMVPVSTLKSIGRRVVDIHGQHDHQALMDSETHLQLLDKFAGSTIEKPWMAYQSAFQSYSEVLSELKKYQKNDQDASERLDLLRFQKAEIEQAGLEVDEEEGLLEEKGKLNNFEKIYTHLQATYQLLSGEQATLELTSQAMSELTSISTIGEEYQKLLDTLTDGYYLLEDANHSIRNHLDSFEFDEVRLEEVETRLDTIQQLKRKYNVLSIEELLAHHGQISEAIEAITNKESRLETLQQQLKATEAEMLATGQALTKIRKQFAEKLNQAIHSELQGLYMEKAIFEVRFEEKAATASGLERVEFYLSTNPGEPLKPLAKIASGGELSRIMLAMKNIFSKHQGITTIIFDEIDSGVSGRVAQAIAEKIYSVSGGAQVLCISHLPHVASMADTHIFITKEQSADSTKTNLFKLSGEERIEAIGKMISGKELTTHTAEHVREMMAQAETFKSTLEK